MITIGKATLLHIDCMAYMAPLPDKAFELAIVDPPYRDINEPDQWLRSNAGNMKLWPPAPKVEFFNELSRVSKNQIIWGGNYFTEHLAANNNWVIWHKLNEGVHFSMCELAWSSIKKNVQLKYLNPCKDKIHPTQKPILLYEWLLNKYAKPGQHILDTHLGSGSSAIACNNLGYEMVGCELDEDYYKAACNRVEQATKQERLFA